MVIKDGREKKPASTGPEVGKTIIYETSPIMSISMMASSALDLCLPSRNEGRDWKMIKHY